MELPKKSLPIHHSANKNNFKLYVLLGYILQISLILTEKSKYMWSILVDGDILKSIIKY